MPKTFSVVPYTEKVDCVCRSCNNHWMSDLEGDAKRHLAPIIRDEWNGTINADAQRLVAMWIALRAAILDQVHPEHARTLGRSFHTALYNQRRRGERRPPNNCWISIARYSHGEHPPEHHAHSLRGQPASEPLDLANPNGYEATFTVGHLVAHIVGFERPMHEWQRLDSPAIRRMLRSIWPTARRATWPPDITLEPRHVAALSNMFG